MTAAIDSVATRLFLTRSGIGLLLSVMLGAMAFAQPPVAPPPGAAPPATVPPVAAPPGPVAQPQPPPAGTLPQVVQPASPTAASPALPQILRPAVPAQQNLPSSAVPQPNQASPSAPHAETPAAPQTPPAQIGPPSTADTSGAASPPAAAPGGPAQTPPPQATSPGPTGPPSPVGVSPAVVSAEQIAPAELTDLLGHVLFGDRNAELGRIVDLLVDTKGHVRAVVLDVGGFMGVGNRKVAVAWSALRFTTGDKGPVISTEIAPDRIKSWADYIAGRPVAILGTAASGQ